MRGKRSKQLRRLAGYSMKAERNEHKDGRRRYTWAKKGPDAKGSLWHNIGKRATYRYFKMRYKQIRRAGRLLVA